ncbi:hypothetical protein CLAIMM_14280 [Cladophialophora immunda]|nr:hypothetical protein CLAIMM_14280 [Cladophialophora immunda]
MEAEAATEQASALAPPAQTELMEGVVVDPSPSSSRPQPQPQPPAPANNPLCNRIFSTTKTCLTLFIIGSSLAGLVVGTMVPQDQTSLSPQHYKSLVSTLAAPAFVWPCLPLETTEERGEIGSGRPASAWFWRWNGLGWLHCSMRFSSPEAARLDGSMIGTIPEGWREGQEKKWWHCSHIKMSRCGNFFGSERLDRRGSRGICLLFFQDTTGLHYSRISTLSYHAQ